ncbi:MAG: DsbA family protein [Pseudomonadota bacterium]
MQRFLAVSTAFAIALLLSFVSLDTASAQEAPEIAEMTMGDPDAPVTVVEYASFTCPHCRTFHEGNFKRLKADYIDTGKVFFTYREVYFDRPGLWAAMVARCGGEERYFGIVDLLYAGQSEWGASGDPVQVAANLRRIGKTAGLTDAELDACMSDAATAQAMVTTYQTNAEADGVSSTPSFVINGETYRNMNYEEFSRILDEAAEG